MSIKKDIAKTLIVLGIGPPGFTPSLAMMYYIGKGAVGVAKNILGIKKKPRRRRR
jgi:hypothetical protein